MISFTNTIHIDRPIEEVYAYLSDLEHTPGMELGDHGDQEDHLGTDDGRDPLPTSRSVPQAGTEVLEITALETGRHIEVVGTLAQFPARLSYRFDRTGSGTELTNTVNLEPQGALRLVAPVVGNRIKRAVADNLGQLKRRLESGNDSQRTTPA